MIPRPSTDEIWTVPGWLVLVALVAGACASGRPEVITSVEADPIGATAAHFESIRDDPEALREFFSRMPLGADLHHHVGGAAPPGMMIGFAAADSLCLPADEGVAWRLAPPPCAAEQRPVAEALEDEAFHAEIERRWSMQDYESDDPSIVRTEANDHFFSIFPKIRLANRDLGRLVAGVRSLAAAQGITYLETSSGWVPDRATRADLYRRPFDPDLEAMRQELLADPVFVALRDATVEELPRQLARSEELLGCDTAEPDPGCDVEVRFQRIAIRNQPPAAVFVQTLLAYEVDEASDLVVGVNLVAPETGEYSLRDYALHMRMFGELAAFYPDVRRSLHTAEMTDGQAVELGARDHLPLAIGPAESGGAAAHRIGHGVALDSSTGGDEVLARMHELGIAVELNLRSNELLLGVRRGEHPLPDYLAAGVPIMLSTDDPGLMNTDLPEQFVLASSYDEVDYPTLRRFVLDSVEYSFLAPEDKERILESLRNDLEAFERGWLSAALGAPY